MAPGDLIFITRHKCLVYWACQTPNNVDTHFSVITSNVCKILFYNILIEWKGSMVIIVLLTDYPI